MRALDIMIRSVVTATPDMTIHDAARLFVDNRINGMPVVDANGMDRSSASSAKATCCIAWRPAPATGSARGGSNFCRRRPASRPRGI